MGLKIENINLTLLSSEQSLRYDFSFLEYKKNQLHLIDYYTFSELFEIVEKSNVDLEPFNEINYVEIGNISKQGDINPVKLDLLSRKEEYESYYKKIDKGDIIRVVEGDILISSIRPNLKKIVLIDYESQEYFYTKALIHLKPKIDPIVAYYLLRTVHYDFINNVSRIGKGYPTLKTNDLKTLTFDKKLIDSILKINVQPIKNNLNDIKNLINAQENEADIINEVLIEELQFDIEEFKKVKNERIYNIPFEQFAENIDLRYSSKFHHPAHKYMLDFLYEKTNKRVKDFVSESIVLGKTISPKQYEENTNCYYMSMATIKSWYFDKTDAKEVSKSYENDNLNKKVAENDIIIARSGEGTIGKVALIDDTEINAIFADFTMRIRLKNYNYDFAYYYFRSMFFQHLIEHNKKGLGNNTNIFPSQISEFPMLDLSIKEQAKIVKKIKDKILAQQEYTKQIEEKRSEIEKIILDSLQNI